MRSSRLARSAAGSILVLLAAIPALAAGEPLRVSAERRGFYVGAAVNTDPLGREAEYDETLGREFNACVAENVFKFGLIHPERDRYDFAAADEVADFAQVHGMKLRGH